MIIQSNCLFDLLLYFWLSGDVLSFTFSGKLELILIQQMMFGKKHFRFLLLSKHDSMVYSLTTHNRNL